MREENENFQPDRLAGWVVLTDSQSGKWDLEWDGELFSDMESVQASCNSARNSGWRTALAEVRLLEVWEEGEAAQLGTCDLASTPHPKDRDNFGYETTCQNWVSGV